MPVTKNVYESDELNYTHLYKWTSQTILGFIRVTISSEQRGNSIYKHICQVYLFGIEVLYFLWRTGHYDGEDDDDNDFWIHSKFRFLISD